MGLEFLPMKSPSFAAALSVLLLGSAAPALGAKPLKVTMSFVTPEGVGKKAGTITVKETKDGVTLETDLKGLPAGEHGFHMHEKASCEPADKDGKMTAAQAAGAHFDPDSTKAHKGPAGGGHKGDLPKLQVSNKGVSKEKLEVKGLTLADNYSDSPKPLGGGGDRIVCGAVP
jgi:Cu-Zn family superoxide dismutase